MKRALSILAVLALVFSSFALVPSDRRGLASASEEGDTGTATILRTERERETVTEGNSCPRTDDEWTKVDGIDGGSGSRSGDETNDWGSLSWSGKKVEWDINDGWVVELCVKSGSDAGAGFDENYQLRITVEGLGSRTIDQEISHLSYKPVEVDTPEEPEVTPEVTVEFVKEWAGDPRGDADATLTVDGDPVPWGDTLDVTDHQGQDLTVTETVAGLPANCTSTADTANYTVPVADAENIHDRVTITNTVDCDEDETEVESTWPLTVVKSVAGPIPDDDFAFTVDCGDFQLGNQNESFTIDAEGGKKLIGIGIPEDTECTVTETGDANAAETSVTVNDGDTVEAGTVTFDTIDEATTVTFLNTFSTAVTEVEPTAPLTVEKVVDGPAPDDNFDFSLDCDGFGVGSDATFSIDADGGTHTTGISIPEGTECTVTETGDAGAEETFVAVNGGQREAADHATFDTTDKTTTVTFRNTFTQDPDETTDPGEVTDPGETNDPDETEVKDKDVTPVGQDPTTDPDAPAKVADEDVTEVADKTLVAVEEEGALPTRIDAGGGGLATSQGPLGLTALVALMGGLFLALTRRSHRDQTV